MDQAKPDLHTTHSKLASKPCRKFTAEDCGTNVHTVHLISAELIEEISGIKRIKDLSDPSTGRAATESTPVSCATVKLHSSGNKSSSQCVMRRTATENSSGDNGNTSVSQSLSDNRNAAPGSAACKFLQGEVTVVRKTVSLDAKLPLSTHHNPVDHTESINGDCAHESKTKPKSLWVAMNSGLW